MASAALLAAKPHPTDADIADMVTNICRCGTYQRIKAAIHTAVAEVSVSPKGEVTIHRIVGGTDCGYAVNPDQIAAQVEGSFVFGLSAMLTSEITIDKGRVVETNFDTYQVTKLAQMPKVDTVLVRSGGFWGGVGEPTIAVAPRRCCWVRPRTTKKGMTWLDLPNPRHGRFQPCNFRQIRGNTRAVFLHDFFRRALHEIRVRELLLEFLCFRRGLVAVLA